MRLRKLLVSTSSSLKLKLTGREMDLLVLKFIGAGEGDKVDDGINVYSLFKFSYCSAPVKRVLITVTRV